MREFSRNFEGLSFYEGSGLKLVQRDRNTGSRAAIIDPKLFYIYHGKKAMTRERNHDMRAK